MPRTFVAAVLAITLAGCLRPPIHYTVAQRGSDTIVLPPRTSPAATGSPFEASIKNARSRPPSATDCAIVGGPITISWRGDTAQAQLDLAEAASPAGLSNSTYSLERALDNADSKGCLEPGQEYRLTRALIERLPLPSLLARNMLFGGFDLSGYVDLTPAVILELVSPIYPSGVAHIPSNLVGYETADYSFAEIKGDDRIRASLSSTTEQLVGRPAVSKAASQIPFPFSPPLNQFRFLLRSEKSNESTITRAIILSAPQKALLNEATAQIQAGLADFCQAVAVPSLECVVFPSDFAVNVKLRIVVNGKGIVVPFYTTVGDLVDSDSLPNTLRMKRTFEGHPIPVKFDPRDSTIRKLAVMPGDRITW